MAFSSGSVHWINGEKDARYGAVHDYSAGANEADEFLCLAEEKVMLTLCGPAKRPS
jgi:hypothetical protein